MPSNGGKMNYPHKYRLSTEDLHKRRNLRLLRFQLSPFRVIGGSIQPKKSEKNENMQYRLYASSGGSFRGDSFGHRYPRVCGGPLRGRSGRHHFLGRGQGRGHHPHPKNLTHNSHQKNM